MPDRRKSRCLQSSPRCRSGGGWLIPTALAVWMAAGCASSVEHRAASGPAGAVAPGEPSARALQEAESRQQRRPDAQAKTAPPPPGVPGELAEPLEGQALERALLPLDEALALLRAGEAGEAADDPGHERPQSEALLEARRSYVYGRAARLSGDLTTAERELKRAARQDPSSPEVWRELGETLLSQGNRGAAASAFRRVLRHAPDDVRSLDVLSRSALERREFAEAALLSRSLGEAAPARFDPALPYLADARLGRALGELGYLRASETALRRALELPDAFGQSTSYQAELGLLYRQRGDMWRDIGDAAMRLGDFAGAEDAYTRAGRLPSLNPAATTGRLVFALMRQGRSARAALVVFEEIRGQGLIADDRSLGLIRHIAAHSSSGPALGEALAGLQGLPESSTPQARSSLARARAAALPDAKALAVLREHLRVAPADDAAIRDLTARLDRSRPEQATGEIIRLIEAAPLQEARYAQALLSRDPDPARTLRSLGGAASPGARLLRARVLAALGELEGAERELETLSRETPDMAAAIVARTSILSRLGRDEEARALLSGIEESSDPQLRRAKVLALAEVGEIERSLALLQPLLPAQGSPAGPEDAEPLLLAARLNLTLGRFEEGAALLHRAAEADPARDEAYAGLIGLYSRQGPMASDARMIEVIRTLRDTNPSSPTLRWLRALEALGRGQLDLAERDLLDLAEEQPDRQGVIEHLVKLWLDTRQGDRALEWLRDFSARRPESAVLAVELAELLAARGGRDEAIAMLEERLARAPGELPVSRALETILRSDPSQRARADELARARLARSPRTPEALVERIEVHLSAGEIGEATAALRQAAGATRLIRADLVARLSELVLAHARSAMQGKEDGPGAVELCDALIDAVPGAAPDLHIARIVLLGRTGAPVERVIGAAEKAGSQHPAVRVLAFNAAVDALIRPGQADFPGQSRLGDALAVMEHACTTLRPPPVVLHAYWVSLSAQGQGLRSPDSLARAVELAYETDTIVEVLDEVSKGMRSNRGDAVRTAEVSFWLAGIIGNSTERADLSERLYRTTIRLQPDHIFANNNLGYRLLTEDRDIEEAARMIEVAYEGVMRERDEADRVSVIDSLGWARYKTGVLLDETDADGTVVREGAVTLLRRALDILRRQAAMNPGIGIALPIIADHLADALWAAGRREEAIPLWEETISSGEKVLDEFMDPEAPVQPAELREIQEVVGAAREKIRAARDDRQPEISRIHRRPGQDRGGAGAAPGAGAPVVQ